jgi:hypothetical protein
MLKGLLSILPLLAVASTPSIAPERPRLPPETAEAAPLTPVLSRKAAPSRVARIRVTGVAPLSLWPARNPHEDADVVQWYRGLADARKGAGVRRALAYRPRVYSAARFLSYGAPRVARLSPHNYPSQARETVAHYRRLEIARRRSRG